MKYECQFDGKPTKYVFGTHGTEVWSHTATSLARAVRAFRVGVLFPHAHSEGRIATEAPGRDGYDVTRYLSSKPGSTIKVRVHVEKDHKELVKKSYGGFEFEEWVAVWYTVAEIPPEDPEAEWRPDMLPAAVAAAANAERPEAGDTALARATPSTGLATTSRAVLVDKRLELDRMMGDLEKQRRALAAEQHQLMMQVERMQEEMQRRLDQMWLIELFLGSEETVLRLRDGAPAPAAERISVYQSVLCMDEEIAVTTWLDEPDAIGEFDYANLKDFDDWLLADPAHLDAIIPARKGVRALRVRRYAKDRGKLEGFGAMFERMHEEELDRMVYLLVRNGEQLSRLWVDVVLWPRFFPRLNEWDWLKHPDDYDWKSDRERDQKKAAQQAKTYVAGLVVIQGLCQRSDLFHPIPAGLSQLDIFDPAQVERHFDCVRDDETDGLVGDGSVSSRLTWSAYGGWLREQLRPGVRVFFAGRQSGDSMEDRVFVKTVTDWPATDAAYVLEESPWRCWEYSFLYLPDDDVWPGGWGSYEPARPRAKRVRFGCDRDDLWPVDFISWRVVRHLLRDRGQRRHYGKFFGLFGRWYRGFREVSERQKPFVDLVLSQSGTAPTEATDADRARVERLLRWWRSKTKVHRELKDDENKALRMIVAAFKRGDDGDDDPEKELFARLAGE